MHGEENEDAERMFYNARRVSGSEGEDMFSNETSYTMTEDPQPTSLWQFTLKWKFSRHLFCSPQNILGASQESSIAAFF